MLDYRELNLKTQGRALKENSPEFIASVQLLPKREIINFLIQNFFRGVNWMYEMIHPSTFLNRYEKWWAVAPGTNMEDLEFGVLVLRICAYSAQFLPCREYTAETICGVALSTIREDCHTLAKYLSDLCEAICGAESLISVQHLFLAACYSNNEGRMKKAWHEIGSAIRLAQDLGMHLEMRRTHRKQPNDLEKELRRRAFWNLYVWDRLVCPPIWSTSSSEGFVYDNQRFPCCRDDQVVVKDVRRTVPS